MRVGKVATAAVGGGGAWYTRGNDCIQMKGQIRYRPSCPPDYGRKL